MTTNSDVAVGSAHYPRGMPRLRRRAAEHPRPRPHGGTQGTSGLSRPRKLSRLPWALFSLMRRAALQASLLLPAQAELSTLLIAVVFALLGAARKYCERQGT